MDILLIGLGILLIIGGIIGSVLPFLPGPPLSYAGLLMLHFTEDHQFTSRFLIIWAIVTVVTYLIDYSFPYGVPNALAEAGKAFGEVLSDWWPAYSFFHHSAS
jgi:uncharacterized protein YqgC (DUF456 family)